MQTVVYADLLVILNIIVTLIIIIITSDLLKIDSGRTRYITGSVAGGFMSLIILAPALNIFVSILVRVLISVVIVMLSFRVGSMRLYLKCFLLFNAVSFFLAGIMFSAGMLIRSNSVIANNGYVYVDFSITAIILIICASFFFIKLINKSFFMKSKKDLIFDAEIFYDCRKVCVRAFYDSGNNLTDVYTGKPVIVVSLGNIIPLIDDCFYEQLRDFFDHGEYEDRTGKIRLLPVRTLGSSCLIPAFTAESAIITGNDIQRIIEKPTIAVSDNTFEGKTYSALINETVTGQVI